jgi:hypothetical protein
MNQSVPEQIKLLVQLNKEAMTPKSKTDQSRPPRQELYQPQVADQGDAVPNSQLRDSFSNRKARAASQGDVINSIQNLLNVFSQQQQHQQ